MAEVKVKVCGITHVDDARLAVELGAAMLGFNFYPRSPRYIAPADARLIMAAMPSGIALIGVFVNATLDEIASAVVVTGIGTVQLHGDETAEFCRRLKRRLPGVRIIKAFHTEPGFVPETAFAYPADAVLMDAASAGFGGSGIKADWACARAIASLMPGVLLAGGLDAVNVADAIRYVQPAAIDVCSGVESVKGRKDPARMRAFFAAVRRANEAGEKRLSSTQCMKVSDQV